MRRRAPGAFHFEAARPMLAGIDKCVVRAIAPNAAELEADPSWLEVPGLLFRALF